MNDFLSDMIGLLPTHIVYKGKMYTWRIKKIGQRYKINYIGRRENPNAPYPVLVGFTDVAITKCVRKMLNWCKENRYYG